MLSLVCSGAKSSVEISPSSFRSMSTCLGAGIKQCLINYGIKNGLVLRYSKTSKLCKNIGDRNFFFFKNPFDFFHDLLDHVFIIIMERERLLHGKSTANVIGV